MAFYQAHCKAEPSRKLQSGLKTPSKFLALDFLVELQSNNYISAGGLEYSAIEVDFLVAQKTEDSLEGFYEDQMDLWEASAEAEVIEAQAPVVAVLVAAKSFVLNVVTPALCRFFSNLSQGVKTMILNLRIEDEEEFRAIYSALCAAKERQDNQTDKICRLPVTDSSNRVLFACQARSKALADLRDRVSHEHQIWFYQNPKKPGPRRDSVPSSYPSQRAFDR